MINRNGNIIFIIIYTQYNQILISSHILLHFQLDTFFTFLTEGHIGLTGWKLFYINKQTIKMASKPQKNIIIVYNISTEMSTNKYWNVLHLV